MKALKKDLQSVIKTLKALTKKTEQLEKALEKINWKFGSMTEALMAYDAGKLKIHEPILVQLDESSGDLTPTTVGRIIFNAIVPEDLRNYSIKFNKKQIKKLNYWKKND